MTSVGVALRAVLLQGMLRPVGKAAEVIPAHGMLLLFLNDGLRRRVDL